AKPRAAVLLRCFRLHFFDQRLNVNGYQSVDRPVHPGAGFERPYIDSIPVAAIAGGDSVDTAFQALEGNRGAMALGILRRAERASLDDIVKDLPLTGGLIFLHLGGNHFALGQHLIKLKTRLFLRCLLLGGGRSRLGRFDLTGFLLGHWCRFGWLLAGRNAGQVIKKTSKAKKGGNAKNPDPARNGGRCWSFVSGNCGFAGTTILRHGPKRPVPPVLSHWCVERRALRPASDYMACGALTPSRAKPL